MEEPAPTEHDVHELIRKRWSPRAFSSKTVSDGQLQSLFEAARWAASCLNELAAAQLTLQATALGLAVHQMAGFSMERARELFAIPEDFESVAAIALGYPGNPDELPEDLRARELGERSRKPQSAFVFDGNGRVPLS